MKPYGQFCPVAKTAEIFAERWTPLILRELCFGPRRFNQLRSGLPLISRTLLSQRLRELECSAVVESAPKSTGSGRVYRLTEAGEAFRPIIELMGAWSQRWGPSEVGPEDLDPGLLMWSMRRQMQPNILPERQFVMQFEFVGVPKEQVAARYWWLVVNRPEVDICQKNPGHDVDIVVYADLAAFTKLWVGQVGLEQVRSENGMMLRGSEEAQRIAQAVLNLREQPQLKAFSFGT